MKKVIKSVAKSGENLLFLPGSPAAHLAALGQVTRDLGRSRPGRFLSHSHPDLMLQQSRCEQQVGVWYRQGELGLMAPCTVKQKCRKDLAWFGLIYPETNFIRS